MRGRWLRTDEELVDAFQAGDSSAFDVLVAPLGPQDPGRRSTGSWAPDEEARDLCQEAFLKAYRGAAARFKQEARFSSWLYQIALNALPRPAAPAPGPHAREPRRRSRRRRGRRCATPARARSSWSSRSDLSRAVAAAVAALPEEQREVIVLKEYQGLTFPEIAETLDVPLSTVKTRLYRGLGQLRQRLERQGIRGARRRCRLPSP